MVITTTWVTQMHDIKSKDVAKRTKGPCFCFFSLQPQALTPDYEKSLRKHAKTNMKHSVSCSLQHLATISAVTKTCVFELPLPCPPLVLLPGPLHASFISPTSGSQVPGVDPPCSLMRQVRGASPRAEKMQARQGIVCLMWLLSRIDKVSHGRLLSTMLAIYKLQA